MFQDYPFLERVLPDNILLIMSAIKGTLQRHQVSSHTKKLLQTISLKVKSDIEEGNSKESILGWGNLMGYSFYIEQFYDFWIDFFIPSSENT